jgi:hypothetical protein
MTPKEYIEIEHEQQVIIDLAQSVIDAAYDEACNCPIPANLRRAGFKDNIENTVLWKPKGHRRKWLIIEEMHRDASVFWFAGGIYFIADYFIEVQEKEISILDEDKSELSKFTGITKND